MQLRITCLLAVILAAASVTAADEISRRDNWPPPGGCCTCGQYWRVTYFCAPVCRCYDPSKLEFQFYDCRRDCWVPSTCEAFLAADDPEISTCFFLPGYEPNRRSDHQDYIDNATKGGWLIYNRVAPRNRRFRMVLWAWPADREEGTRLVSNMRETLAEADLYSWYLAWLVDQMHPQVPIGFVSDSIGAACLTGALHLLGGASIRCTALSRVHPDRRLPSAAMMASTMDNRWMSVTGRHYLALSSVDKILITVNPTDRMLKLYVKASIGGGGMALGATGIVGGFGPYRDRIRYLYAQPYVGGRHWWTAYLRSPPINAAFRPYAFPMPSDEPYLALRPEEVGQLDE
jgi:hypothetical protein